MGKRKHSLPGKVSGPRREPSRGIVSSATWWLVALLTLTTVITFAPAINNGFTKWDDPLYVTENHHIRDLSYATLESNFRSFIAGNYHPLTMVSLALDYRFWRLNPKGYHLTNVVIHVVNTLAVFALILLLTSSRELAVLTALFFGIHPLHVESVAWVSARKDVLYALFYLGACISYVLWLKKDRLKAFYYAGALGLFLLSLLSKGMAVTLPLVLLLIDFYAGRRVPLQERLLEKAPFFLLSIVFGVLAVAAQKESGAVGNLASTPLYERALVACYGFLVYLFKGLVPVKLSAFYPYPDGMARGMPLIFWIAPLLVAVIALGVYRSRLHGPGVMFGALFYLVNVVLVLQLIPVGRAITADRYTYVSYIGVGFVVALGCRYFMHGPHERRKGPRRAVTAVLAVLGGILMFAARARCEVWKDNLSLWSDVIAKYPTAALAYKNRAITYRERGDYERATADVERALSLDPNDAGALSNRGNLFYSKGSYERALVDLGRAISLDPSIADAWNSRGAVRARLGRYEEALTDFDKAIELKPDFPDAYLNRANTFLALKRYDRALAGCNAYIAWEPGDARGYFCRGIARFSIGDLAGANEDYGNALRIRPEYGHAYFFRSKAQAAMNQYESALRDALHAQALGYPVEQGYLETLRKAAR
ncbi:MAG TPA: tetratricopeptide repeat protein [Candidatus Eisenbacteria bacterium]|jgi:tetratricopeptide (TPR) repeat protein